MFRAGKSTYTAHPGSGATVDWSNPLTQGLRSLIVAGQPSGADIVRGVPAINTWNTGVTENGAVVDGASDPNSCQYVSAPRELITTPSGITFFATAQNDRSGSDPLLQASIAALGVEVGSSVLCGIGTGQGTGRQARFYFRDTAGSVRAEFITIPDIWVSGDKGQKVVACSYAGPGTQLMYANGSAQALTVISQLSLTAIAPTNFSLGALTRAGSVLASPRLKTGIGGVWDRALSAQELEELTINPWGLIAVPRGRSFVAVGYTSSGVALPTLTAIAPASITQMTCIPRTSATWA